MIYLFWIIYFVLALIIGTLIRNLFSNIFLKRLAYAFFLSLALTSWFLFPGSRDISPILPIYFVDLLESQSLIQMRLIRPLIFVFLAILILDLFIFRNKSKKK